MDCLVDNHTSLSSAAADRSSTSGERTSTSGISWFCHLILASINLSHVMVDKRKDFLTHFFYQTVIIARHGGAGFFTIT